MYPVIASAGWYNNPAPNPATATASSGWKEYGNKDVFGKAITGHSHCKYLSEAESQAFASKSAVLGY